MRARRVRTEAEVRKHVGRRRKRKRAKGAAAEQDAAATAPAEPPAGGGQAAADAPTAADELAPFQAWTGPFAAHAVSASRPPQARKKCFARGPQHGGSCTAGRLVMLYDFLGG